LPIPHATAARPNHRNRSRIDPIPELHLHPHPEPVQQKFRQFFRAPTARSDGVEVPDGS